MTATSTVTRPARPAGAGGPARVRGREPGAALLAGGRSGAGAVVLGLLLLALPVVLMWWGEDRSGTDVLDAVRAAAQLWLVAHGVVLELPDGRLGLTPLGLSLLPVWLCWRAGRRAAEAAAVAVPREALHAAGGVCLVYGGLAVVVAVAVSSSGPVPVLWTTVVGPVLLSAAAASAGALRALPAPIRAPLPVRVVHVLRLGTGAALLLLAAGALLVGLALALDAPAAAGAAQATEPGAVGGLGLVLLGASLAPNAAVWGASWLAGPGFAVGAGTSIGPFGVELGPVPALPLLTALPETAPPAVLALLALAVPVLAGLLAGRLLGGAGSWPRLAGDAVAAGVLAGALLGLLAALAGGPLGGERLAVVGPSGWQIGLAVAAQVAVGVAAGSALRVRPG